MAGRPVPSINSAPLSTIGRVVFCAPTLEEEASIVEQIARIGKAFKRLILAIVDPPCMLAILAQSMMRFKPIVVGSSLRYPLILTVRLSTKDP